MLLPTCGYAFSTANSVSMTFDSPITSYKVSGIPKASGLRLHPAAEMFCKIPMPPTAIRNQVFCFIPAAVMRRRIQNAARIMTVTIVVYDVEASTLVGPAARSSTSSPLPSPIITIACWLPFPLVKMTVLLELRRHAHFSLGHCRMLPIANERRIPDVVTKRMLQSPNMPHGTRTGFLLLRRAFVFLPPLVEHSLQVSPHASAAFAVIHPSLEVPHDAADYPAGIIAGVASTPIDNLARTVRGAA